MADSLDKLTIRGFKSIRALEEFELKDLNVLIGGNGAGKSNLVDFFRLLRKIIDGNIKKIICFIAFLCLPLSALALEPAPGVKVTQVLKTTTSWDDKPIVYPEGKAEVTGLLVEVEPGAETGWHLHQVPSFAMVLEGTLEVRLKDGQVKRLQAGEALAEVVNTLHNDRNVGDIPVKIVVFYVGAVGEILTIKEGLNR